MPIWLRMWSQPVGPTAGVLSSFVRISKSALRIEMMRVAMPSMSDFHSAKSLGSLRMSDTCVRQCLSYIAHGSTHDSSAIGGGVGDLRSLQQVQLALETLRSALAVACVTCHHVERSDALPVQARVLGKRLAHEERHVALDKVSHRPRVRLEVARGKALVRTVEEGVVTLGDKDVGNLLPLLLGGVDAGGVVRARVQEEHGLVGRGAEEGEVRGEGEANRRRVVVRVFDRGAANIGKDGLVVRPRRVRDVDDLVLGRLARPGTVEALEEESAQMVRARARNALDPGSSASA